MPTSPVLALIVPSVAFGENCGIGRGRFLLSVSLRFCFASPIAPSTCCSLRALIFGEVRSPSASACSRCYSRKRSSGHPSSMASISRWTAPRCLRASVRLASVAGGEEPYRRRRQKPGITTYQDENDLLTGEWSFRHDILVPDQPGLAILGAEVLRAKVLSVL